MNTITIPKDELDVSGAKANIVRTIDLNDYLPDGVSLAGMSSSEITVTLTVEQLKEREYTVRVDSDCYAGANSAYSYQSDPSTVTVPDPRPSGRTRQSASCCFGSELKLFPEWVREAIRFSRNSAENWIPHMIF